MNISIIVLSNGDKVIGEVGYYDNGNFILIDKEGIMKIKNPFILKEIMTQEGFSIVPLPLVPTSEEQLEINSDHIMIYPCTPKEELLNMYKQMTSNILIPKNNKIQLV